VLFVGLNFVFGLHTLKPKNKPETYFPQTWFSQPWCQQTDISVGADLQIQPEIVFSWQAEELLYDIGYTGLYERYIF